MFKRVKRLSQVCEPDGADDHQIDITGGVLRLAGYRAVYKGKPVYEWFTEGFDTVDLQEAKGLLETLKA